MRHTSLRKRLAREAARLLYSSETDQLFQARHEAQRRLSARDAERHERPSKEEIEEELHELAARFPLEQLPEEVITRLTMLRVMRLLAGYRPRWEESANAIHLCSAAPHEIETLCTEEELAGQWHPIAAGGQQCFRIAALGLDLILHNVASWEEAVNPLPAGCWSISDVERQLAADLPAVDLYSTVGIPLHRRDRFAVYRSLLLPLEEVQQSPTKHPEGDALYHSLQVYQLTRDERPYDEELQLAALLHDVGLAIDPVEPVSSALAALNGFVTERTAWLIEQLPAGHQILANTIGQRAQRRLEEHEDYEELLILARADRDGRQRGAQVNDVDHVLEQLQNLAQENG